jgi:integrase
MKLKKVYFASYNNFNDNFFVFGGEKPLAPTSIDRYKKKACDKANIRPITQHQFRHSHATLLVDNGFPITTVSKRLGHSKVSTTLDYYVHNSSANEKRVVATLNFLRF